MRGSFDNECGKIVAKNQFSEKVVFKDGLGYGGRYRFRTCDPCRVKAVLYR